MKSPKISNNHSLDLYNSLFKKHRLLLDTIPGIVCIFNIKTGKYIYINKRIKKLLGYDPQEFIEGGVPFAFTLVHPDDIERLKQENNQALDKANATGNIKRTDKEIYTFRYRFQHKNGLWRWLRTEASVFSRSEDHKVEYVLNISLDITEHKDSEEHLKKLKLALEKKVQERTHELEVNEARFRALIEKNTDAVALIGKNARLQYVSPTAQRMFGYNHKDFRRINPFKFVHPKDYSRTLSIFRDLFIHPGKSVKEELRIRHVDGTYRWIEVIGTNLLFDSSVGSIVANFRDITERKINEERQNVLDQISNRLLNTLDHQNILQEVVTLLLSYFSDYCRLVIVDENGEIKEISTRHKNSKKVSLTKALYENYIHTEDAKYGVKRILRTGKAEHIKIVDEKVLNTIKDPKLFKIVTDIGLKSYIGVPLVARGKIIGAMTLSSSQPNRFYDHQDFLFAQEIARRIALALDNAHLYKEALQQIEGRKKIEEQLKESLAFLDNILATAPAGIAYLDNHFRFVKLNKALADMNGVSIRDSLGKTISEVVPKLAEQVIPVYKEILRTQKPVLNHEISGETAAQPDKIKHWLTNYYPVYINEQQQKKIIGIGIVVIDITERKEAEAALIKHSTQLEILSKTAQEINRVLDIQIIMRTLVTAALSLVSSEVGTYGLLHDDEIVFSEYIRNDRVQPIDYHFKTGVGVAGWVMHTHQWYISNDVDHDDHVLVQKRKSLGIYNLINLPIHDKVGNIIGCFELHNKKHHEPFTEKDVRILQGLAASAAIALENAQVLQKQKELDKQKDEFLSIASHELKTPVTSIKAHIQLLRRHTNDNPRFANALSKVESQIDKLTKLIQDLLDISRLQAGKLEYKEEIFDFNMIADEIIDEMQPLSEHHKIIKKSKGSILVKADRYRISQVLVNLLSNAIKYAPDASIITVGLTYDDKYLTVSVKDEGIGIPKDKQAQIFSRFYRVMDKKRASYPGLGLGLYISNKIVQKQHGKMWFESEEGKGSTFYFTLPRAK